MLIKFSKAQSTLEYALLISVVVGGLLTMQNYLKRVIQGNLAGVATSISPDPYSPGLTEKRESSNSSVGEIVEKTMGGFGGKTTIETKDVIVETKVDSAIKGLSLEKWPAQRK
ncbi:MAG: hypothetical protein PHP17_08125 [Candidatus Omnitrophica bacterium]|nr:hypothetical protein [Candidatus Omnitrophota bacterium]